MRITTILLIFCVAAAFAPPARASQRPAAIALHVISVTINLKDRTLAGTDRIIFKDTGNMVRLVLRLGSSISAVTSNGRPLEYNALIGKDLQEITITLPPDISGAGGEITVAFSGTFQTIESARGNVKRGVAFVDDGVMGEEGAFLPSSSLWYPREEGALCAYDLTVALPAGYSSVSEGELLKPVEAGSGPLVLNRWKNVTPLAGLDLVAGRYIVEKEQYNGIDIYTYFFKKDDELSRRYIEKTKSYLDFYGGLIGNYPFGKFAVVESFLPTGYGMPSFTLLGSSVIRLPFIPDTSLGHEIAHNWWGNSVYVKESSGNWTEAITTYTADYLYAEKKGEKEAKEFRLSKLRGYKNFAGSEGVALKDFNDSTTPAARSVGYNKGMMVFNMLRSTIGKEAFSAGLKQFYAKAAFKPASWNDLQTAFEKASGKDLAWFFSQWVERPGAPSISISGPAMSKTGGAFEVSFRIKQQKPTYIMALPVVFTVEGGKRITKEVKISKEEDKAIFELEAKPVSFEIDPDYENFRLLADAELPPSFGAFFGDKNGVIILPSEKTAWARYKAGAELLSKDFGQPVITDDDAKLSEYLRDRSALIFGAEDENRAFTEAGAQLQNRITANKYSAIINGKAYGAKEAFAAAVCVKNGANPSKNICAFTGLASGADKALDNVRRLRYFSEESYVVFTGSKTPEKGTFAPSPPPGHAF